MEPVGRSLMASWSRKFDEPITLPAGKLCSRSWTVGDYIAALPNKEPDLPEWALVDREV